MLKNGKSDQNADLFTDNQTVLQASGERLELPDESFVRDADMNREGMDLVLKSPEGVVIVENYFAVVPAPVLTAPDGAALTPELVESFARQPLQYADSSGSNSMADETPVGAIQELSGQATVTRMDGTVETIQIGMPIYQGDIIETSEDGAVNILFIDETSFAVSEDARLAIDEYVFDPSTQSGSNDFSLLKGVFVFTSGLIGREDPDDVSIETPVGSIGIRGTIIAGDVDSGEITVVEGAIVLRDFSGNEMTLANQFETARFDPSEGTIENMGQITANDLAGKFSSLLGVVPQLFSSIGDAIAEASEYGLEKASEATEKAQEVLTTLSNYGLGPLDSTEDSPPPLSSEDDSTASDDGTSDSDSDGDSSTTEDPPPSIFPDDDAPVIESLDHITLSDRYDQGDTITLDTTMINVSDPDSSLSDLAFTITTAPGTGQLELTSTPGTATTSFTYDQLANGEVVYVHDGSATLNTSFEFTVSDSAGNTTTAQNFNIALTRQSDLDLATMTSTEGFKITDNLGLGFGSHIIAVGDSSLTTAKDSYDDFAIGRALDTKMFGFAGTSSLTDSTAVGADSQLTLSSFTGPTDNISYIGDFNGDGLDDFVYGLSAYDGAAGTDTGAVAIMDESGTVLYSIEGANAGDLLGSTVTGAGDLNGDGYEDVVIYDPGVTGGGRVVLGGSSPVDNSVTLNITDSNSEVLGIGDFDGDGKDDLLIADPTTGSASINYGGNLATQTTISGINVSSTDVDIPIASLGDVNGDGIADIGVGSTGANNGKGTMHVIYGDSALKGGSIDVTTLNGTNGYTITTGASAAAIMSAGAVGDFNGDGVSDTAIAIKDPGSYSVDIFVLYGGTAAVNDGLLTYEEMVDPQNAFFASYEINAGHSDPDNFQFEIGTAGDINGDGLDDMVIGTPEEDNDADSLYDDGSAYVIYGQTSADVVGTTGGDNLTSFTTGDIIDGLAGNDTIDAGAADQVLIGGEGNDFINQANAAYTNLTMQGGAGDDTFTLEDASFQTINGGAGHDIVRFDNDIDFSGVNALSMQRIEQIDMIGNSIGQTLTLSTENITNLLSSADNGLLLISSNSGSIGDTNDVLQIDTGGAVNGTITDGNNLADLLESALGLDPNSITYTDTNTGFDEFSIGGHVLKVDEVLIDNTNVTFV